MTLETFIQLATGATGAIVVLVVGFVLYARAVSNGALVPGRYYEELVRHNRALTEENKFLRAENGKQSAINERTASTIEQVITPRSRGGAR